MIKKVSLFVFIFFSTLLYGENSFNVGALPVKFYFGLDSGQEGDFDKGDTFVYMKSYFEQEEFSPDTLFLPYVSINLTFYNNGSKLKEISLKRYVSSKLGAVLGNNIDENEISNANKLEITIVPNDDIIKDGNFNDAGTLWDSGYKITLYDLSVTDSISWNRSKEEFYPSVFYPWNNWDNIFYYINNLIQIKNDINSYTCNNDNDYLKTWWSFFGDPSDLQDQLKTDTDIMLNKFCNGNVYYKDHLVYLLDSLAYVFFLDNIDNYSDNYETYEFLWVWSNNFYDLIEIVGSREEWDKSLNYARYLSLEGKKDEALISVKKAIANLQSDIAEYYVEKIEEYSSEMSASVSDEALSFAKGVGELFKWDMEKFKFENDPWETYSLDTYKHLLLPLFKFWLTAEELYMKSDEETDYSETQSFIFSDIYYNTAEKWILNYLSGNDYNNYTLYYSQWKNAVLMGKKAEASQIRSLLSQINEKLLEEVGK